VLQKGDSDSIEKEELMKCIFAGQIEKDSFEEEQNIERYFIADGGYDD
jgi:hypothetical protein